MLKKETDAMNGTVLSGEVKTRIAGPGSEIDVSAMGKEKISDGRDMERQTAIQDAIKQREIAERIDEVNIGPTRDQNRSEIIIVIFGNLDKSAI